MSVNYYGTPASITTGTAIGEAGFTQIFGILNSQVNGALQALAIDGGIITDPDENSFLVTDTGGLTIGIGAGSAVVRSAAWGAVAVRMDTDISVTGLTPSSTTYVYVAAEVDATIPKDTRISGDATIVFSEDATWTDSA